MTTMPEVRLVDILSHPAVACVQSKLSPPGSASAQRRIVYLLQLRDGWYFPGLFTPLTVSFGYDLSDLAADLRNVEQGASHGDFIG